MPETIHDVINRDRLEATPAADQKVQLYREYAEGKQRGTLSFEQRAALLGLVGHDHADNLCDTVLATGASRVEFERFEVDDKPVLDELDSLIIRNQLIEMNYDMVYRVMRDGNHCYGLSWRPSASGILGEGRVIVSHEPWWDGKLGTFVQYANDGRTMLYAVKDYNEYMGDPMRKRLRRVIWYPDHIERYIRNGQGWDSYRLESDPPSGPILWQKRDGSPLGVPIVHFANARFGKAPYGVSDLAGGVIGLQDDINDFQRDLSAAGRLTAFQMFYVTGMDPEKSGTVVGPGRLLYSKDANSKFGTFGAGDLGQLIDGHKTKVSTVARNTMTPQHLITGGDWPSGEALVRAESPLADRAGRVIRSIHPAYATLGHRTTEMINAFGRGTLDEDALITAVFKPAERRDDLTLAQIEREKIEALQGLKELGFSDEYIWKKYGLTPAEITAMKAQNTANMIARGETIPVSDTGADDPIDDGE